MTDVLKQLERVRLRNEARTAVVAGWALEASAKKYDDETLNGLALENRIFLERLSIRQKVNLERLKTEILKGL